jgi:rifampin ADP-ribosylating transferase
MSAAATVFAQAYLHGTRAALHPGELIVTGHPSNFRAEKPLSWVYFTATLDTAIWGAELAIGEGQGRIYLVEPVGTFEDDPNVTNKRFPGNPTLSYRSQHALRVLAEVVGWHGHPVDMVQERKDDLARMREEGTAVIID